MAAPPGPGPAGRADRGPGGYRERWPRWNGCGASFRRRGLEAHTPVGVRGRQLHPERGAPAHLALDRERPPVRRHDGVTDREAQTHSLPRLVRREEGIEEPAQDHRVDAGALIDDVQPGHSRRTGPEPDDDRARLPRPGGLGGVRDQVHHHLLDLAEGRDDLGGASVLHAHLGDLVDRGGQPVHRLGDDVGQALARPGLAGPREDRELLHDPGDPAGPLDGVPELVDHAFEAPGLGLPIEWLASTKAAEDVLDVGKGHRLVGQRGREGVVDLVGHAGRQRPHRGETRGQGELALEGAHLVLGPLALRDVRHGAGHPDRPAGLVPRQLPAGLDPAPGAPRRVDPELVVEEPGDEGLLERLLEDRPILRDHVPEGVLGTPCRLQLVVSEEPVVLERAPRHVRRQVEIPESQLSRAGGEVEAGLLDAQRLLGTHARRDVPGQVGERGHVRDVVVVVVGGPVSHAEDRADPAGAHHRDGELADDLGMSGRHSLPARSGGVVVVDHRLAGPDAVGPHPGLVDRIVGSGALRGAHPRRWCSWTRPAARVFLVVLDEVEEPDPAPGELLRQVERGGEEFLQGRLGGALEEAQAGAIHALLARQDLAFAGGCNHGVDLGEASVPASTGAPIARKGGPPFGSRSRAGEPKGPQRKTPPPGRR